MRTVKQNLQQSRKSLMNGNNQEALHFCTVVLTIEPDNIEALFNTACAQSRIGVQLETKQDEHQQAMEWYKDATNSVTKAISLMDKQHKLFVKAHELNRNTHELKQNLVVSAAEKLQNIPSKETERRIHLELP